MKIFPYVEWNRDLWFLEAGASPEGTRRGTVSRGDGTSVTYVKRAEIDQPRPVATADPPRSAPRIRHNSSSGLAYRSLETPSD